MKGIGRNLLRIYEDIAEEWELFSLEMPEDRRKTSDVWRMAAENRREVFLLGSGVRTRNKGLKLL